MEYQFYWPNWWKLWPYYNKLYDNDFKIMDNYFCFSVLQLHWRSTLDEVD